MDDSEKFSETYLPKKEDFYSHPNMEGITDCRLCTHKKSLKSLILGEYLDLYVQNDTLLLADVFEGGVLNHMNLTLLIFLLHQD